MRRGEEAHLVQLLHHRRPLLEVVDRVGDVGRFMDVEAVVDLKLRLARPDLLAEAFVCEKRGSRVSEIEEGRGGK